MNFSELKLTEALVQAVQAEGYTTPTPIQAQAIPHVLEGRDLLGCAQTGTGKTAAFALPVLQRLSKAPVPPGLRPLRTLVLTPTRELASQIAESFEAYGRNTKLTCTVIFGGVGQDKQVQALRRGVDILVATPGRLLDLMHQGLVKLSRIEVFILDEADRMLDMGFIHDVRKVIAALPRQRQTLLFSATMPQEIQQLSKSILVDPVRVEVTPVSTTAERIDQRVYFVEKEDKRELLVHVLRDPGITRTLVFTRTKHGADRVVRHLDQARIQADAIHGNKSQGARERALGAFKSGQSRVLVATDIAARGIDIDSVSHVVNFDLPNIPESYVHRIGRTGRAGAAGIALSFCDAEEREYLADIQRLIRQQIPVVTDHPHVSKVAPGTRVPSAPSRNGGGGGPQRRSGGGQRGGQRRAGQGQSGAQRRTGQGSSGGGQQRARGAASAATPTSGSWKPRRR